MLRFARRPDGSLMLKRIKEITYWKWRKGRRTRAMLYGQYEHARAVAARAVRRTSRLKTNHGGQQ